MRKKMRAVGVLFFVFSLVCSTVSCGQEVQNVQVEENLGIPEYISFFSSDSSTGEDIGKYWSEQFAEQYNREVYIDYDGATYYADEGLSYRELLEKRLESSVPDDLYIIKAEDVIDFEKKGYWMDLSDMDFVDNLTEAALYQSTYKGKVFSVPLSYTGFGFCWNVDLLKEHDLSIPENLEEFLAVCEQLKSDGVLPYGANKGYALTVPAMCSGMAALYQAKDSAQQVEALNSGELLISNYMRGGFELLSNMIKNQYLDPNQALGTVPGDEEEMFLNGECAFICTSLDTTLTENSGFQIEMTGVPVLPEGSIAVYGAKSRLCVNPETTHMDTVCKFIEMVGTAEALDKSAEISGALSSAQNSGQKEFPGKQKIIELLRATGQIPNQDFSLHFNTWENIRDVCRLICEGDSIEDACIALDEIQKTELEEYNYD